MTFTTFTTEINSPISITQIDHISDNTPSEDSDAWFDGADNPVHIIETTVTCGDFQVKHWMVSYFPSSNGTVQEVIHESIGKWIEVATNPLHYSLPNGSATVAVDGEVGGKVYFNQQDALSALHELIGH
jgi:hypothetical protein